jgi:hypothetical protein
MYEEHKHDANFENFWIISACTLVDGFQNFGEALAPTLV